jgi:N-glycosylase/DNA lyase
MDSFTSSPDTVFVPAPYIDLAATLDGGQAFRWWPDGEAYNGVVGRNAIRVANTENGLAVRVTGSAANDGIAATVIDYMALGADLEPFRTQYQADPCIGPALRGYPGLRLLRQEPWECLAAFICSSTSNIPRIKLNIGAVAAALGQRVGPGVADFAFPSPAAVAAAGEKALRDLGLGFRAKFLAPAAEAVASGRLDLMSLRERPYDEARAALTALAGVGEKIADCVLAFSLDKPESFPIDRWTRRALEEWYGLPAGLNNSRASDWARTRFGHHGALAQQYMFHRERLLGRARAWGGEHIARALPEDAALINR